MEYQSRILAEVNRDNLVANITDQYVHPPSLSCGRQRQDITTWRNFVMGYLLSDHHDDDEAQNDSSRCRRHLQAYVDDVPAGGCPPITVYI
jgi:hypothetical protein